MADDGGLAVQREHLTKEDIAALTPLTPEVISRQPTINIGTIGHVAHGKSTLVKAISGVTTVRFRNELERNITIKLGYANAKIYKCKGCSVYAAFNSSTGDRPACADCPGEEGSEDQRMNLVRHTSFVDCPGHDILMATMLNGAAVMDAAMLLIAGNESCPQPQTSEHLAAIEIMKLKHIIVIQNKVDLVKKAAALEQHKEIKAFVKGTIAEGAPIIPISAQLKYNVDIVAEAICRIPVPLRDFTSSPRMIVIRSFDVNKPGCEVEDLQGGVAGGSILRGVFRLGQEIECRPGIVTKNDKGVFECKSIMSRVVSLHSDKNTLQYAVPGGLVGMGSKMDPSLCRMDGMVGQVIGEPGQLPEVFTQIEVEFFLLRRLLGVRAGKGEKQARVKKLERGEAMMINIGSTSAGGRVLVVNDNRARIALNSPVCAAKGEKIALSRRVDRRWRLVGWGKLEMKEG